MIDLLIKNANLPDGRQNVDIAIDNGLIVEVDPGIQAQAVQEIDAAGRLATAPFVDSHFHMDSTLTYGRPRVNASGTLLEGIELWGELKPGLTAEDIKARAMTLCHWAIARGTLAIRSHVDVSDDSLMAVRALLEVREAIKPYIEVQLVAFPQDGYFRHRPSAANLERALDLGVDVVGGIPHFERTMADGAASLQKCHVRNVEDIGHQAHSLVDHHASVTRDGDPGTLLAAVLQRVQAEIGELGGVRVAVNTEKTAGFPGFVLERPPPFQCRLPLILHRSIL